MHLPDTVALAIAKLHSRRLLLVSTVLVSSALFGLLFAGNFLVSGIDNSMKSYANELHDGKYLVRSKPLIPQDLYPSGFNVDPKIIKELNILYSKYIERERRKASNNKTLFDEKSVLPPLKPNPIRNPSLPDDRQLMIDFNSPVYIEYAENLMRKYAENAPNSKENLKILASKYKYDDIYTKISARTSILDTVYLDDGKEDLNYLLKNPEPKGGNYTPYGFAINSVQNSDYRMIDDELLQRWIAPPNERRRAALNSIPVIISTKEAVTLFGESLDIPPEPKSTKQKIEWIKNLQKKINGHKYTSCYRNSSDRLQTAQAINTLSDIEASKMKKDYIPPKITYRLPVEACGAITIDKDNRSTAEKALDQKSIQEKILTGIYDEPRRKLLEFQIVGLVDLSETSFDIPRTFDGLTSSLFSNNLDMGAVIPRNMYETSGAKKNYDDILFGENTKGENSSDIYTKYGLTENILTFNSLSSAQQFIKNEGCPAYNPECKKLFTLDQFGSNYLLLEDIKLTAYNIMNTAFSVILAIAGIILFFTMSRIIVDSRRETAVFRSLGAKRVQIVKVYVIYSLFVSMIILCTSIAIGILGALVIQFIYGSDFTMRAHMAYGLYDSSTTFSFLGISYIPLITYVVCIIALGIISTLLPLIRNVRRNPIADMRDE